MRKWPVLLITGLLCFTHSFAQVKTADRLLTWSIGEVKIERGKTVRVSYPLMVAINEAGQQPQLGSSTIRFFYDAGYLEDVGLEQLAQGYRVSGLNESSNVLGEMFGFPGAGGIFAQFNLIADETKLLALSDKPVHVLNISFTLKPGAKMPACIPLVLDNHPGSQGLGAKLDYGYLPNEGGIVGTYYLDGLTDQVFLADDEARNYLWEFKSDFADRLIKSQADRVGAQAPTATLAASGCMEATKKLKSVDLKHFRALGQGQNQVFLEWSTSSEFDNDHFEVQRSKDGVEFATIGTIKGSWNNIEESLYGFVDDQAHPGNFFYRIRQVDGHGKSMFTEVRMVSLKAAASTESELKISLFPNPTAGLVNVSFSALEPALQSSTELLVLDATGRLVLRQKEMLPQSSLDLGAFDPGVYQVVLKNHDQEKVLDIQRVVRVKE